MPELKLIIRQGVKSDPLMPYRNFNGIKRFEVSADGQHYSRLPKKAFEATVILPDSFADWVGIYAIQKDKKRTRIRIGEGRVHVRIVSFEGPPVLYFAELSMYDIPRGPKKHQALLSKASFDGNGLIKQQTFHDRDDPSYVIIQEEYASDGDKHYVRVLRRWRKDEETKRRYLQEENTYMANGGFELCRHFTPLGSELVIFDSHQYDGL